MTVHDLPPGEPLPAHGSAIAVVIVFGGRREPFVRCASSVLRHTPPDVPILVADDASPDPASRLWLDEVARAGDPHQLHWMRGAAQAGYAASCNAALTATAPTDVVLLDDDHAVAAGWIAGLRDAARTDSIVGTVVPFVTDGPTLSVGQSGFSRPRVSGELTLDEATDRLQRQSPRARPRIPVLLGGCALITRAALDTVGGFDEALSSGESCRLDFGQRCLAHGLQNVVADDVLLERRRDPDQVYDDDAPEAPPRPPLLPPDPVLDSRYPYVRQLAVDVEHDRHSSLRRALLGTRASLRRPSITIDGRALTESLTGTQVHAMELISALWRTGEVAMRIVVPPDLGTYARETFEQMSDLELVSPEDVPYPTDIVHRPYQVSHPRDLRLLLDWGDRVVITNQDLISYRTPDHFASFDNWTRFRILTAEAMAVASFVLFFSRHAAKDVLVEDILPAERARVVPIGVDHRLSSLTPTPTPPKGRGELAESPYLLVLGSRYRHKNRLFALRLLEALRLRHGWDGRLVLAGPEVAFGSSSADETGWLAAHPEVAPFVVDVAAVDEGEKAWLYRHATAVLYPSIYEGFGLIPFEAADHGKPCLWAHGSALAEILPAEHARLVPWDPERTADQAIDILRSNNSARLLVEAVRAHGAELTWDRTAARLLDVYRDALATPTREMLRLHALTITSEASYWGLREAIGSPGMSLVDPHGALLPEDARRTLAALARRPATRGPLLSALRALGGIGRISRGGPGDRQRTWLDGPDPPDSGH